MAADAVMPNIEFERWGVGAAAGAPDGGDQNAPGVAFERWGEAPSMAADVAKSAGIGLIKGGIGLAGNPAPMPETLACGPAALTAAPAGEPWIGCPAIFITNPGEQISGMQTIPGHIVRIQPDGRICMFLTADNSEPIYRDNLHRRGSPAGNGRVHQFNCWDFNPEFERDRSRLRHLEEAIGKMADEGNQALQAIADLRQTIADLTARVTTVESPEPPGAKAQDKAKKPTAAA
jgi:hypothetical protein